MNIITIGPNEIQNMIREFFENLRYKKLISKCRWHTENKNKRNKELKLITSN